MSLDILYIHPNASKKIYQELSKDHSAYEPPIWAGMLANHCRAKNFKTAILDCEVKKLDYEKSAKEDFIIVCRNKVCSDKIYEINSIESFLQYEKSV